MKWNRQCKIKKLEIKVMIMTMNKAAQVIINLFTQAVIQDQLMTKKNL